MTEVASFLSSVPQLIVVGSGVIVIAAMVAFTAMLREARRAIANAYRLAEAVKRQPPSDLDERTHGIEARKWEEIRVSYEDLSAPQAQWWTLIEHSVERYTSPEERAGYFTTVRLRDVLTLERLIGTQFHAALYSVIPGVLTGFGLFLTFVAILLALMGVSYDRTNAVEPVKGIDTLINGLSGKFLSSIVALLFSIFITIGEKATNRKLRNAYDSVLGDFEARLPYLSQSRILLDIQRFASKQTVSISSISSDVVDRLIGAIRHDVTPGLADGVSAGMAARLQEEFRPTMQQMGATLEELRRAIVSLETQKHDSVAGELRGLLQSLQESMVQSLGRMGDDFHQALSGAASREFSNVQGTLEGTRQMLDAMNERFSSMQSSFSLVIAKAEEATTNQLATGREQTEALVALMSGLMVRMQETADHNVSAIRNQLTLVLSDLSEKVGGLSAELMNAAKETAAQSKQTAEHVLHQTGSWSEATAQRLEHLLANVEARSNDFRSAGQTLLKAHEFLTDTIAQNAHALERMAVASKTVESYTNALAGHAKSLEGVQAQHGHVAKLLKDVSSNVASSYDRHETLLQKYQQVFDSYKTVFEHLDGKIATTFKHIKEGMEQYTRAVEANFEAIVTTTNQTLPHIADALSAQTQELEQHLEELNSLLSKGLERLSARAAR